MKIEYIFNSGFTLETEKHFLIFDYYKGELNLSDKKTTVFITHGHADHYNKSIFDLQGHINYVLSDDIELDKDITNVTFVKTDSSLKVDDLDIEVFGSTDLGVSFLISVDGFDIFHAGDLNWWYWENDEVEEKESMERDFKKEISKLKGKNIDLAFFPVDPRLGDAFSKGGEYFINELSPRNFIPMHFGDNFHTTTEFIHKMKGSNTNIVEISKENQIILL